MQPISVADHSQMRSPRTAEIAALKCVVFFVSSTKDKMQFGEGFERREAAK
jgi:hypothetical protein